jgi:hypothetical protein
VSYQSILGAAVSFLCVHIQITERDFFQETVKIVLGTGEEEIDVPNRRLCEVSEFFNKL